MIGTAGASVIVAGISIISALGVAMGVTGASAFGSPPLANFDLAANRPPLVDEFCPPNPGCEPICGFPSHQFIAFIPLCSLPPDLVERRHGGELGREITSDVCCAPRAKNDVVRVAEPSHQQAVDLFAAQSAPLGGRNDHRVPRVRL